MNTIICLLACVFICLLIGICLIVPLALKVLIALLTSNLVRFKISLPSSENKAQIHHLLNLQNTKHSSPQPRQLTPQATYERFLKLHATEFHGGPDPTIAKEWVKYLEVIFEYLEMSDRDIIYCALFLMKNEARHW